MILSNATLGEGLKAQRSNSHLAETFVSDEMDSKAVVIAFTDCFVFWLTDSTVVVLATASPPRKFMTSVGG